MFIYSQYKKINSIFFLTNTVIIIWTLFNKIKNCNDNPAQNVGDNFYQIGGNFYYFDDHIHNLMAYFKC